MEKYLIVLDLDGTIISGLYNITDYTIKIFNKIRELGHKIVIVTGRPFRSSEFIYRKLNLDTPIANYNGQLITNPSSNEYIVKTCFMKKESILEIYNHEKDNFQAFFAEEYDNIYSNLDVEFLHELMHLNNLSKLYVGDLNDIIKNDIHGSLVLAKDGCGEKMVKYINDNFKDIGARLWSWSVYKEIVEIFSTKINKGDAIRIIKEELGFDSAHTIICWDSKNDLDSYSLGDIRITPNNGEDEIKKLSTIILDDDVTSDAVPKFFEKFFNLEVE